MTDLKRSSMSKAEMMTLGARIEQGEITETRRLLSGQYDKYLKVYIRNCDDLLAKLREDGTDAVSVVEDLELQKTVFERALARASNDVVAEPDLRAALYALRTYRKIYEHNGD